jgi:maltooligosyltrehalose trehalohydrolase
MIDSDPSSKENLSSDLTLGSVCLQNGGCRFDVWAPHANAVDVHILAPEERFIPLKKDAFGYHSGIVEDVSGGVRYLYRLDGQKERPDPASRFQPEGVHGPSAVVDPGFDWEEPHWPGIPLQQYIIYELHVGTFTREGTFEAVIERLDALKSLGITAVELMPIAQFPGDRNWGYDGVNLFAAQNSYGGPAGLKRLVDACHRRGLAVILDVVYNHFGPEGNYIGEYGPYFSDRYQTPWGSPINFDGAYSDDVRRFFIQNGLYWVTDCRIDALRLDAVHAIFDFSARPFLQELAETVHRQAERLNRRIHLMPESSLNDTRLIRSRELDGFGMDAQWNDDFHHSFHTVLTGEQEGYYRDFGRFTQLIKAYREGFVYSGEYSPYRKRRHGNSSRAIDARRFVVFSQNHDQVGNRMNGERLSRLVPFDALKLAAGAVLLSPYLPLLFMGEEYGETAPFPYFISHTDPDLVRAVREGRRSEFADFKWMGEPPDPQDERTFMSAKLDPSLRQQAGENQVLYAFYQELLRLRRETEALNRSDKERMEITGDIHNRILFVHRWSLSDEVFTVLYFQDRAVSAFVPMPEGDWEKRLDSSEERWQGEGSTISNRISSEGEVELELGPYALVLFARTKAPAEEGQDGD